MIARSYLFVPGIEAAMLAKAMTRDADVVIVDLEDAVAGSRKAHARTEVREWLRSQDRDSGVILVRINNEPQLFDGDLAIAAHEAVSGIVVPKIADVGQAQHHAESIQAAGVGREPLAFLPMIESASAMSEVEAIATVPGVTTMMIGEYDFAAELGIEPTDSGMELLHYRSRLVLACAAAGIDPPVAPVHNNFRDLETFRSATIAFKRMGYVGRATIHPAQALVANEVFSPTREEIARAERTLELLDEAIATGSGVATDDDGHMIDEAVVRSSRRLLARARLDQA